MLGVTERVHPAYLVDSAETKHFSVLLPFANGNVTPAGLRGHIDTYVGAVKAALTTWAAAKGKADAIAKEKAECQPPK